MSRPKWVAANSSPRTASLAASNTECCRHTAGSATHRYRGKLREGGVQNIIMVSYRHYPESKVHGANMGPIWGRQDPGGPHVDPMNFAIWVIPQEHQQQPGRCIHQILAYPFILESERYHLSSLVIVIIIIIIVNLLPFYSCFVIKWNLTKYQQLSASCVIYIVLMHWRYQSWQCVTSILESTASPNQIFNTSF